MMKIQLFTIILIRKAFLSSLNEVEGKSCRTNADCSNEPGVYCKVSRGFIVREGF